MSTMPTTGVLLRPSGSTKIPRTRDLGLGRRGSPLPDLFTATIEELQTGLESGSFTSLDLVRAYVRRIEEVNAILHCVMEVNSEAEELAKRSDDMRQRGMSKGMLFGIPVLLKDSIAMARPTSGSMQTTMGHLAFVDTIPPHDSTIVEKLNQAGAIIMGKTNQSEFGMFQSSVTSSGWSARGGQTYAAYHPHQTPRGSSSGAGVAASLGLAAANIGVESNGSITIPADVSNVCAIKPTVGLTSRFGGITFSSEYDSTGPLTTTVRDAAHILTAIAGRDPRDRHTEVIPFAEVPNYAAACSVESLRDARIGIPDVFLAGCIHRAATRAVHDTLPLFAELGATIVRQANFSRLKPDAQDPDSGCETFRWLAGIDCTVSLQDYLASLRANPAGCRSLEDIRAWTRNEAREEWPMRDTAQWDDAIAEHLALGTSGGIDGALDRDDLDALIMPAAATENVANLAGHPIITVPLGYFPPDHPVKWNERHDLIIEAPGIPFGLSFVGRRFSEEKLIAYAYAFEQRSRVRDRVDPLLLPVTQLIDVIRDDLR